MVADAPKHDLSCRGSFWLTPSKYRRTTSSALVSEALGVVVPDVEDAVDDSTVAAFNDVTEGVKREGVRVEKADTTELVATTTK
mmetsp:Transcript_18324/g.42215  ORF Transcript_18324/g.42215 Transcript_18324/m.42215 type:complete len:84 (+) Transcript_18324:1488-1739(+)